MSSPSTDEICSGMVSCIVPVYNRSAMLKECVDSVRAQTYANYELILVDDGSTDDTLTVARSIANEDPARIHVLTQKNAGAGMARNTGFAASRGEFIQYLDSDDLIHPSKFELQVRALQQSPEAGVCYCVTLRRDARSGQMVPWARTGELIERIFPDFLPKRGWATLTPLWRRSVCRAIGPWKDFRVLEDWEHDLRAGMREVKIARVDQALCTVRDHAGDRASGMTSGITPQIASEMFRAHREVWYQMKQNKLTGWAYVQPLSRTLFWLSRLCAERDLYPQAKDALDLSLEMCSAKQLPWDVRIFQFLVNVAGWRWALQIAELINSLRNRRAKVRTGHSQESAGSLSEV